MAAYNGDSSNSPRGITTADTSAVMTRRRTIHNYPEHLNPFHEHYAESQTPDVGKYGTWSANNQRRVRGSILESTWMEALNLTPAKKKVTKKWSLFKSRTVEKFQRARSKSDTFEHRILKNDKLDLDINARRALFASRIGATSTPVKNDSAVLPTPPTSPECEDAVLQEVKPRIRKKRAAPRPPSSILSPDPDLDQGSWSLSGPCSDDGILQLPDDTSKENSNNEVCYTSYQDDNSSEQRTPHLRPLIEQPNIATLISNNLTL